MTKEEIIKYVLQSPENTNANVLGGVLDELEGPKPTGTIEITNNGTVDVSEYAEAEVNVSGPEQQFGTITIINNTGRSYDMYFNGVDSSEDGIITKSISIANNSTATAKVLLKKFTFYSPPKDPILAIPANIYEITSGGPSFSGTLSISKTGANHLTTPTITSVGTLDWVIKFNLQSNIDPTESGSPTTMTLTLTTS